MQKIEGIRMVEISGEITSGMFDYNILGLPGVTMPTISVAPLTTLEYQGYMIDALQLTTLSGTYVESARHMEKAAPLVDEFDVKAFIKPAKIMRLPPAKPYHLYSLADLEAADPGIDPGDALIIQTGWGSRWNTPGFCTTGPACSYKTADWFIQQPYSMLGMDCPVLECLWAETAPPNPDTKMQALIDEEKKPHPELLGQLYAGRHDMLLFGPLVNLDQIKTDEGTVIALPIRVRNTCSAPCRAVFLEGVKLKG